MTFVRARTYRTEYFFHTILLSSLRLHNYRFSEATVFPMLHTINMCIDSNCAHIPDDIARHSHSYKSVRRIYDSQCAPNTTPVPCTSSRITGPCHYHSNATGCVHSSLTVIQIDRIVMQLKMKWKECMSTDAGGGRDNCPTQTDNL